MLYNGKDSVQYSFGSSNLKTSLKSHIHNPTGRNQFSWRWNRQWLGQRRGMNFLNSRLRLHFTSGLSTQPNTIDTAKSQISSSWRETSLIFNEVRLVGHVDYSVIRNVKGGCSQNHKPYNLRKVWVSHPMTSLLRVN